MIIYTGKSLSEVLIFCRTLGEHVVYINCSECQKQFWKISGGLLNFESDIILWPNFDSIGAPYWITT